MTGHMWETKLCTGILQDEFLATVGFHALAREKLIFQQDTDHKHTSMKPSKWFQWNKIDNLFLFCWNYFKGFLEVCLGSLSC